MTRRNEALEFVTDEFRSRGIQFQTETSGGNHIEIRWQVAKEKEVRSYFVPNTPSDHRGRLNARAHIRKLLRQDGVDLVLPDPAKPRKPSQLLSKAIELPKHVESIPDQLRAIRAELADLTDLMLDLSGTLGVLREHATVSRVSEPAEQSMPSAPPVAQEAVVIPVVPKEKPSVRSLKVIDYLSFGWQSFEAIARDMGLTELQVYGKLKYIHNKGAAVELDFDDKRVRLIKELHLVRR